jgi:hypothetical protein
MSNRTGCPRIEKKDKMNETGEYKIRPYKWFRDGGRGEPCVHPAFPDSLRILDPVFDPFLSTFQDFFWKYSLPNIF